MKNQTMKIFCIAAVLLFILIFFLPKSQSEEIAINIIKATEETAESSVKITQPGTLIQQLPGDRQPDPDITWKQRVGGSVQVWCKLKNIDKLVMEDDYFFIIDLYVNGKFEDGVELYKAKPIDFAEEFNPSNIAIKIGTWFFGGAEALRPKESASVILNPSDKEKRVYCKYSVLAPGEGTKKLLRRGFLAPFAGGTEFYSNKDEPLVFTWNIIQLTSEQIKRLEEYENAIRTNKEIVKKIKEIRPDIYEQFKNQIDEAIKNVEEQKEQEMNQMGEIAH